MDIPKTPDTLSDDARQPSAPPPPTVNPSPNRGPFSPRNAPYSNPKTRPRQAANDGEPTEPDNLHPRLRNRVQTPVLEQEPPQ